MVFKRVIVTSFLILSALGASGQQHQRLRDRDPDLDASKKLWGDLQQANFHIGPWYWTSRLRLSDAGFTQDGYVPTGDRSGGLSLSIDAPNRFYFVPRKKVVFTVDAVPSYAFFGKDDAAKQFNYSLRGDMHLLFNHLYLDAYHSRADQLRAHVADINRLATVKEDETGVAGEAKYSSRTSAIFSVRLRNTKYPTNRFQPDPGAGRIALQVLDREERNARLALHHKTLPRTALFVFGERSEYVFPNYRANRSDRTYVGGGFAYDAGRTRFRVEAGPTRLHFDDPSQPDYQGITGGLDWSRLNGRWNYNFGVQRDLGFSIMVNNPYFVASSASFGVDYDATRRLKLHGRSVYEQDEYDYPVLGQTRRDDISYTSLGFTYGVRRASFGADVGWYERDSTSFGDTESGIRYGLRLSFSP